MDKNKESIGKFFSVLSLISIIVGSILIAKLHIGGIYFIICSVIFCIVGLALVRQLNQFLIFCFLCMLAFTALILLGVIANGLSNLLKHDMLGFYGSILGSLIAGVIGTIGAIYGAKIGGKESYKGALEAVKQQIEHENELIKLQEIEKIKKLNSFYETFLREEIAYNYRAFGDNKFRKQWKDVFIKNDEVFTCYGYDSKHIKFDEFNSIRHEVISTNSEYSKEIIDIYVMFKMLKDNEKIENLNQDQYDFVKNIYTKYIDLY